MEAVANAPTLVSSDHRQTERLQATRNDGKFANR
jgi:hypothetical protein